MSIFFVASIYFYARGVFALFGQTIFYTKRILDRIEPENLPAYLKEIGTWQMVVGTVFLGKALIDSRYPTNNLVFGIFIALLVVCTFFLARCNERYTKK